MLGEVKRELRPTRYSKIFVTRGSLETDYLDRVVQSTVGLDEVLAGLSPDDTRLRDAVLKALAE